MILIADSGSTKTDWALIDEVGQVYEFYTLGINPYFYGPERIREILLTEIPEEFRKKPVRQIYFYGAGCSSEERVGRVGLALKHLYPDAALMVDHDLLGAARALCGTERGFAVIMGTGSNACLFDGKNIMDQHGGVGYILGDEASGAYFGKQLIQRVFYNELPQEIQHKFDQEYGTNRNVLINKIYGEPDANRYLASFALFYRHFLKHPYMQEVLKDGFREFCRRHILYFSGYKDIPFNALGSIAYHFQPLLQEVLEEFEIKPGRIIRKPIDRLVTFHVKGK